MGARRLRRRGRIRHLVMSRSLFLWQIENRRNLFFPLGRYNESGKKIFAWARRVPPNSHSPSLELLSPLGRVYLAGIRLVRC